MYFTAFSFPFFQKSTFLKIALKKMHVLWQRYMKFFEDLRTRLHCTCTRVLYISSCQKPTHLMLERQTIVKLFTIEAWPIDRREGEL